MAPRSSLPALVATLILLGASTQAASAAAPAPPSAPPGDVPGNEGILLDRDELLALPTQGEAWQAIISRVEAPRGGSHRLGARDESNTDVLAHALAGARLDDDGLRSFVRDKIARVMRLPRPDDDILATLRNLQTYVISADVIELSRFDPATDTAFRSWLQTEIRAQYSGGGGGGSVVSVHRTKVNNFGTHAGATRLAAALYLGDEEEFQAARDVWYSWTTGDPESAPEGRLWSGTDWQCDPELPRGINGAGCTRDGHSLDGVLPEDQRRCGEYAWPPCGTTYVHGAADGLLLSFWMLARHGESPWEWGDQAALRQMRWKYEVGHPPYEGFRWQIPVVEAAYGIDLPGNDPTATSTSFGFADWWAQSSPPAVEPSPSRWTEGLPEPSDPSDPSERSGMTATVASALVALGILVTYLAAARWKRRRSRKRRRHRA